MGGLLRRIYLFQFTGDLLPITPIYVVMFAAQGLSTLQISVLIASWSATAVLCEVPSGVLADRHDRRYVLACSRLLTAACVVLWIVFPTFWSYLVGFIMWGLGGALHSGTFEAMLYDELSARKLENHYLKVLGRSEALVLLAAVVGSVLAALLVDSGYELVLIVSAIASLISAGVALLLPKADRNATVEDEHYFATLRRGLKDVQEAPGLSICIAVIALAGMTVDLLNEYAPLFLDDSGFEPSGVALLVGALILVMAVGSAVTEHFASHGIRVPGLLCVSGLAVVFATMMSGVAAVMVYGLAAVIAQVAWVLARAELQSAITSDLRATTTSVAGFGQEVLNVVGLVAFGFVSAAYDRKTGFEVIGVTTVLVGLMSVLMVRVVRIKPNTTEIDS